MKIFLDKAEMIICTAIEYIVGLLVFAMVCINVLQVVTRYFIDKVITWIEDVSILSVLFIASLGVAYAWFKGEHLVMDITDKIYPEKMKHILWIICQAVAFIAGAKLVQLGIYNARLNFGVKATGLQYDESLRYVPLVICGFLLDIAAAVNLAKEGLKFVNNRGKGGDDR